MSISIAKTIKSSNCNGRFGSHLNANQVAYGLQAERMFDANIAPYIAPNSTDTYYRPTGQYATTANPFGATNAYQSNQMDIMDQTDRRQVAYHNDVVTARTYDTLHGANRAQSQTRDNSTESCGELMPQALTYTNTPRQ